MTISIKVNLIKLYRQTNIDKYGMRTRKLLHNILTKSEQNFDRNTSVKFTSLELLVFLPRHKLNMLSLRK